MTTPAELIRDDPAWWYMGYNGPATRRLRMWRTEPGRLVAVVTERMSDQGTSITNAAETVCAQLAIEYPDDAIEVVEHYPADVIEGEHFDAVAIGPDGRPTWRRIPTPELVARLGPNLTEPGQQ